jgi:hypothetical protein
MTPKENPKKELTTFLNQKTYASLLFKGCTFPPM